VRRQKRNKDPAVSLTPLEIANGSGFPLQIALEDAMRAEVGGAVVIHREFPWANKYRETGGWQDLFIESGSFRFIVSAKRKQNADWVFVDSATKDSPTTAAILFHADRGQSGREAWRQLYTAPPSPVAAFCAPGGGSDEQPAQLVEREGQALVAATETLASFERLIYAERTAPFGTVIYVPVLATTARLHSCKVTAGTVDLVTGTVPAARAAIEAVPVVRLTKAFTWPDQVGKARTLQQLASDEERTVFVVEAHYFTTFVKAFGYAQGPIHP